MTNVSDLAAMIAAADELWCAEFGDPPAEPEYARFLADKLQQFLADDDVATLRERLRDLFPPQLFLAHRDNVVDGVLSIVGPKLTAMNSRLRELEGTLPKPSQETGRHRLLPRAQEGGEDRG